MAVQFHIAFSDFVMGAGIVAGGPYPCAEGQLGTAVSNCMTSPFLINEKGLNNATLKL